MDKRYILDCMKGATIIFMYYNNNKTKNNINIYNNALRPNVVKDIRIVLLTLSYPQSAINKILDTMANEFIEYHPTKFKLVAEEGYRQMLKSSFVEYFIASLFLDIYKQELKLIEPRENRTSPQWEMVKDFIKTYKYE